MSGNEIVDFSFTQIWKINTRCLKTCCNSSYWNLKVHSDWEIKLENPRSKKKRCFEWNALCLSLSLTYTHTQYLIVSFAGSSCEGNWGREMDKTSHLCVWYRAKLLGQPSWTRGGVACIKIKHQWPNEAYKIAWEKPVNKRRHPKLDEFACGNCLHLDKKGKSCGFIFNYDEWCLN